MNSTRLQKKSSSTRENGNESRDSEGVRTNLDGLNRQSTGSTLGAGARARRLATRTRATSSTGTRAGGGRSGDGSLTRNSGLGHEGRADASGLDSRLEGSRATETTGAGALSRRLGRVVLVKDKSELLGGVAHAVGTVGTSSSVVLNAGTSTRVGTTDITEHGTVAVNVHAGLDGAAQRVEHALAEFLVGRWGQGAGDSGPGSTSCGARGDGVGRRV